MIILIIIIGVNNQMPRTMSKKTIATQTTGIELHGVKNPNEFEKIIDAIEDYIQVVTSRKCNALDDALSSLESLEGDLCSIINDVKEVVEGRV